MGNPPGCKLPRNMLPIVREKSEIDTHRGKEDHLKMLCISPFEGTDFGLGTRAEKVPQKRKNEKESEASVLHALTNGIQIDPLKSSLPPRSSFRTLE